MCIHIHYMQYQLIRSNLSLSLFLSNSLSLSLSLFFSLSHTYTSVDLLRAHTQAHTLTHNTHIQRIHKHTYACKQTLSLSHTHTHTRTTKDWLISQSSCSVMQCVAVRCSVCCSVCCRDWLMSPSSCSDLLACHLLARNYRSLLQKRPIKETIFYTRDL